MGIMREAVTVVVSDRCSIRWGLRPRSLDSLSLCLTCDDKTLIPENRPQEKTTSSTPSRNISLSRWLTAFLRLPNTHPSSAIHHSASMTDTQNRSQRRENVRRTIKNRKESMIDSATIERRMARQQDAQGSNRARAMRAVGVTDEIEPGLLSLSVFKKRRIDVWQGLVLTVLLLTMVMLGVYIARRTYAQKRQGSSIGIGLMSYGESSLSIV